MLGIMRNTDTLEGSAVPDTILLYNDYHTTTTATSRFLSLVSSVSTGHLLQSPGN